MYIANGISITWVVMDLLQVTLDLLIYLKKITLILLILQFRLIIEAETLCLARDNWGLFDARL